MLRNRPGFSAAVVVSLALGIGANTAIFSLMDAVMWRLLPVEQPKALWAVVNGYRYQEYQALAATDDVLAGVAAPLNVSVDGSLEPTVAGQLVTGGYFGLLGADVGQEVGCRTVVRRRGLRSDDVHRGAPGTGGSGACGRLSPGASGQSSRSGRGAAGRVNARPPVIHRS